MIRNYLGFPRGISGAELAARAQEQAISIAKAFSFRETPAAAQKP